MIIKLMSLFLRNFKGQREFLFEPQGNNVSVTGDNGAGKTTLEDAFTWLLFGKDSMGKTDFGIKTLDENNNEIHRLEHEVEGVLEVDGKQINLRRVFKEKWVKKRGNLEQTLEGHTTEYYINGEPKKKGEYEAFIAGLIDENIFKLLTNPAYFNEQMDWKERRDLLFELRGNMTDEEIINSNPDLVELPEVLQGRSVEACEKIADGKQKKIEKEKSEIAGQIKGIKMVMPDISGIDAKVLSSDLASLKALLQKKQQELVQVQSGGEVAEKKKQLAELETRLLQLKNEARAKIDSEVTKKTEQLDNITNEGIELATSIKELKATIDSNAKAILRDEARAAQLREKWHKVNAEQFSFEQDGVCPTCGQPIPTEQLEEARTKAEEAFGHEKDQKLEHIKIEGKDIMSGVNTFKKENEETQKQINDLQHQLDETRKEYAFVQQEIVSLQQKETDVSNNPEYIKLLQGKAELEQVITKLGEGNQENVTKIQNEIIDLTSKVENLQERHRQIEQHKKNTAEIEKMKQKEKDLAAEYERLSGQLYLCKEFTRTKAQLLTAKVNSGFKYARFKLFDTQVNGEIVETCEALYNGVPYSAGLNRGHKNIVGTDIINAFAEYYDFYPPIFMDNAESTTELPETKGQLIRLIKPSAFDDLDEEARKSLILNYGDYDKAKSEYMAKISKLRVEVDK